MATVESGIHQNVKDHLVQAAEQETQLIFRQLRNTSRVADNAVSREVVAKLNSGATFEDIRHLVAGAGSEATREGPWADHDFGAEQASQCP
jgi:NAD(P)H-dependent flavin oxidoreductase YrpB (nitropropane dioxygenase family)